MIVTVCPNVLISQVLISPNFNLKTITLSAQICSSFLIKSLNNKIFLTTFTSISDITHNVDKQSQTESIPLGCPTAIYVQFVWPSEQVRNGESSSVSQVCGSAFNSQQATCRWLPHRCQIPAITIN